jgi:hypothetical protein
VIKTTNKKEIVGTMKTLYIQPETEITEAETEFHLLAGSEHNVVVSTFGNNENHPDWYSEEQTTDEMDGLLISESRAKGNTLWDE